MPEIERYDSDGDAIYAPPTEADGPEWDLDGDPRKMGLKALCAAAARDILGCQIKWWGYYCDWCCGCEGTPHGCDQQCSSLAGPRELLDPITLALDDAGINMPESDQRSLFAKRRAYKGNFFTGLLRVALVSWRKTRAVH